LGVHGGTGAIFAVVKARPYWFTGLFPLIFIVSALASGGALLTFIYAFFGRKDNQHTELVTALGKMAAGFLALDLVFLGSELLVGLYGGIPDHVAVYRAIMFGPFWFVFWGGQLILGALIPLTLILNKRTGNSPGWIGVASALIVIGIVGVRLNIVIPPFAIPLMPGLDTAYPLGRFSTFEFKDLSLLVFAAAIVIFILAAGLLTRYLSQLPARPVERWLARAAGIAVMLAFLVMGLRFLGIDTPAATSLLGIPANLPFFFGGAVRANDPAFYSPSALEWLSSMGVIALAVMGFTLGWILLPLQEIHEELTVESDRFARLKAGR
jgi:molybdopterin-containing oxidoreductase family membrane subunit